MKEYHLLGLNNSNTKSNKTAYLHYDHPNHDQDYPTGSTHDPVPHHHTSQRNYFEGAKGKYTHQLVGSPSINTYLYTRVKGRLQPGSTAQQRASSGSAQQGKWASPTR